MIDSYFLPIHGLLNNQGSLVSSQEAFALLNEPLALINYKNNFLQRLDDHEFARIDDVGIIGGSLDEYIIFLFGGRSPAARAVTDSVPLHLGLAWSDRTINWSEPKNARFSGLGWLQGSNYTPRFHYKGSMGSQATRYFINKTKRQFEQTVS